MNFLLGDHLFSAVPLIEIERLAEIKNNTPLKRDGKTHLKQNPIYGICLSNK